MCKYAVTVQKKVQRTKCTSLFFGVTCGTTQLRSKLSKLRSKDYAVNSGFSFGRCCWKSANKTCEVLSGQGAYWQLFLKRTIVFA